MRTEGSHSLDPETLELFASKGREDGTDAGPVENPNAVKVRRVIQILTDLAAPAGEPLRVLDLACGEGVYSIETAFRGAEVLAVDARNERMSRGARAAERLGLGNIRFEQDDVRNVSAATHGQFDVIFFLGILYHFDVPDLFRVVENLHAMCRHMVIIDTHVCLHPGTKVNHKGRVYEGGMYQEHGDEDPDSIRRTRLLASLDNTLSFWLTKKSLVELLCVSGFTSVFECHVPLEASKPRDRITLVAIKGPRVRIATYPWVNDKTEEEIERILSVMTPIKKSPVHDERGSVKRWIGMGINRILRPLGCRIIRV